MSLGGSPVTVVQLPGGQLQVQGVIQTAQSSVIQSPQGQTPQVGYDDSSYLMASYHLKQSLITHKHAFFFLFFFTSLRVQIVRTHKTPQTVELLPRRLEKY